MQSPIEMLNHWATTTPEEVFLTQPVEGEYKTYTWAETAKIVSKVAAALQLMDLPKGSRIGILSKNCAEWFIADLAIMMAGCVSVPIFSTAGQDTIRYALTHADVKLLFVGKLDNIEEQLAAVSDWIHTVAFPYSNIPAHRQWQDFIDVAPKAIESNIDMSDMMTIIYTSGSTGQPKGVVHTFNSLCWAGKNVAQTLNMTQKDRLVSYLPLAHITERAFVQLSSLFSGQKVYFVESLQTFQRDVAYCQPTLFISVPRLWSKFQSGVLERVSQKKLSILLNIPLVKHLVSKKIRQGLGMGETRTWASGSAPIPKETIKWFSKIGIHICEGWGMTENCAFGSANYPFQSNKIGSIGKAFNGVEIRLSSEGEIQVKSPCNMTEYYLDPARTNEVFTDDGFLKTGDKGSVDSEGCYSITGRLKDIFKTSKGKYVTPAPLESKFSENELLEQVCVTGTNLSQPIALVVLSEEAKTSEKSTITSRIRETLRTINTKLESHQIIKHVVVMKDEWSIENGLLTPTLKVKRHEIEARFSEFISDCYGDEVVWV